MRKSGSPGLHGRRATAHLQSALPGWKLCAIISRTKKNITAPGPFARNMRPCCAIAVWCLMRGISNRAAAPPGRIQLGGVFRWLAPPANFHRPSGPRTTTACKTPCGILAARAFLAKSLPLCNHCRSDGVGLMKDACESTPTLQSLSDNYTLYTTLHQSTRGSTPTLQSLSGRWGNARTRCRTP